MTEIHWFRRSQRNSFSPASLRRASWASSRSVRSFRCLPRDGLHRNHSFSSQMSMSFKSSGSSPNMAVNPYRMGSQLVRSRASKSIWACSMSASSTCRRERTWRGSPPSSRMRRSCRASRTPTAFSWTSQPMEPRSGSSPAVVSTIHTGCFRPEPAPNVMMSHRSRLGWAWSSSKITQLGLYPCLCGASVESTAMTPTTIHLYPPLPVRTRCRYSMRLRESMIFSSPLAIILAVQGAVVSINTAAPNTMPALSLSDAQT